MSLAIGFDIGGTKIAAAAYDENGRMVAQSLQVTPQVYPDFLSACREAVHALQVDESASLGVGIPNGAANMPFLTGHDLRADFEAMFRRPVAVGNDANCAALAEAIDGAGRGFDSVFALTLGTGVGGGFVYKGEIIGGANGLAGEIGHVPLPFYEPDDGELYPCGCGQKGCLEKLLCGAGLGRLHLRMTGTEADAPRIAELAISGDAAALSVLDRYFTVAAKGMVAILHTFDPDVIVVSGGMVALPGLFDEVPKRWGRYALSKTPKTKFVAAHHGATAGLRGAAWLGRGLAASVR